MIDPPSNEWFALCFAHIDQGALPATMTSLWVAEAKARVGTLLFVRARQRWSERSPAVPLAFLPKQWRIVYVKSEIALQRFECKAPLFVNSSKARLLSRA